MNNRKLSSFQGQIETVVKKSLGDLDLRIKRLFPALRIKSHMTAAGIRKWDGYSPTHLMFVLTNLVFLHVQSVHDLMKRYVERFTKARKDTFYRFKNEEWGWRPFYWRFITHLGGRLNWAERKTQNCFILDTSTLPKRGENMEHVSFVYDHTLGRTVCGYETLTLGLFTPTNFYPLDFGYHFSETRPEDARDATVLRATGPLAKRIREAKDLTKPKLALKMLEEALAKGIYAPYLLVDSWFTSPKFFRNVRELNLHAIGRLKKGTTLYLHENRWYNLSALYRANKDRLVKKESWVAS